MAGGHHVVVCEHGYVHGQCRCPGVKEVRRITCPTAGVHGDTWLRWNSETGKAYREDPPMTNDPVRALEECVVELEAALTVARSEMEAEWKRAHVGVGGPGASPVFNPYQMRDHHGRFIVLDALVEIVRARTALAAARAGAEPPPAFPPNLELKDVVGKFANWLADGLANQARTRT